jgi:hypothetical protein
MRMKLATTLAAVACTAVAAWAPTVANADSYAPGTDNQNFAASQGGWTQSSQSAGLCVALVTCPGVSNTFKVTGGTGGAGDGYIDTAFTSLLSTGLGTSTGIWESPAFTYNGNGGVVPATATVDLSIQPTVSALLGLSNTSSYRVDLVDQGTSSVIQVAGPTALVSNAAWASIPTANLNPSLLTLGHSYKIRVSTAYQSVLAVIATGDVGYDNVRLTTAGSGGGGGGGGETTITNTDQLTQLILTQGLPSSATLKGNKLKLKVKCPKQLAPDPCKYVLQGLSKGKKSKPATKRKKTSIKAGKKKIVVIKVKPKFLAKYQKAKKVNVKAHVTVGTISASMVKKMKLIH